MERTMKERERKHARAKRHNQRQAKSARTKRARSKARKLRKDEKELNSVVRTARRKERRERQGEGGAKVQVTPMETEKPKKKLSRSQWGNEKVDDLVRKVLGRQRVWKDTEKRKREKV